MPDRLDTARLPLSREEFWNVLTHGTGVAASVAGGLLLVVLSVLLGDAWQIAGSLVFAGSLILLYSASTLYHAARRPASKAKLKLLDHCAIFVLIAGTYTPFMLSLRGGWGWALFGAAWGIAVAGIVFKLFFLGRFPRLSTMIYIGMGWMAFVAVGPMVRHLPASSLLWLLAGGIAYSAGTLFYHNTRIRHAHAIWHLFVLGGSACHYVAVLMKVIA
jgi:hemolysin III